MSAAHDLRARFDEAHVVAINELIHAADRLTVPELPEIPDWKDSPESFELDRVLTLEESYELGLKWQVLAGKLQQILEELSFDDFENELAGLQQKAERAREAMIQLNGYQPRRPSLP